MNSCFYLTICMNFFTFISHVVSLQFKQPLFIYLFICFSRGLQVVLFVMVWQ
jgi:hypothetical protein